MACVIMPPDIYNQWMFYVKECAGEVSAMGRIKLHGSSYVVTKLYLLDQEVGAAHTDIDSEAICNLMLETLQDPGDLLYWVHSHANMAAFWSGTDLETIKTMGKNGLCVASVFNKKGESKHAVCYKTTVDYTGEVETVLHDDIDFEIGMPATAEQEAVWREELSKKVRQRPYTPYIGHKYDYNSMKTKGSKTELTGYEGHYNYEYPGVSNVKTGEEYNKYDELVTGIFGYGVDIEAKVAKISAHEYRRIILLGQNHESYLSLEKVLENAWREGEFNEYN